MLRFALRAPSSPVPGEEKVSVSTGWYNPNSLARSKGGPPGRPFLCGFWVSKPVLRPMPDIDDLDRFIREA